MPLILDSPGGSSSEFLFNPLEEQRRRLHHEADVVVVGGGVVGCAISVAFAKQGRSVILLERSLKEPDRIVGELMQPGGMDAVEKLGLTECLEDIDAITEKGYNVVFHGKGVHIPYPADQSKPGVPREGKSFHHGRFIRKLREAAMKQPNITVVETTVTSIIKDSHTKQVLGVESLTHNTVKDYYFGALTVVCDGYNSKFRKQYTRHAPTSRSKFWALELIDAKLSRENHADVLISEKPPVLLYQIGTHETRALIDIPEGTKTAAPSVGGVKAHLQNVVLPTIPSRLQPTFAKAIETGPLRSMPNSYLPAATQKAPGLILLGDALNMRHPLTGGGMTVALNDVVLVRDLLDPSIVPDLTDTEAIIAAMKTFHWRRKRLTSVINILAQSLYALFAANNPHLLVLQKGCFAYFQRGGTSISEPAGLLAGIIWQPFVLFYHFFYVAFYSIWVMIQEAKLWELALFPILIIRAILVFWTACTVIGPNILAELKS